MKRLNVKKMKKQNVDFGQRSYIKYCSKKIDNNSILIECNQGREFQGNMFHLCKSIVKNHPNFKISIPIKVEKKSRIIEFLENENLIKFVNVVDMFSLEYYKLLATSKFLINDTSFYAFFNKRTEQVYINTWHGTPLKKMGKSSSLTNFGNVQKNLMSSDYLVLSNQYSKEKLLVDYCIEGISNTKVIIAPSPRNSTLFSQSKRENIREKYDLTNKRTILYMPTYRDYGTNLKYMQECIEEIDRNLSNEDLLIVKLHPLDQECMDIDFSNLSKTIEFPSEELYEFLPAIDTLITDYSSIMYDFLNTGREIILYTFDKEEYYEKRGVYEDIHEYPIVNTSDLKELICTLKNNNKVEYPKEFLDKFIPLDCESGADDVVDFILSNRNESDKFLIEEVRNDKKNIVIFAGLLWDNGISKAFLNMIDSIDLNEANYILFVKARAIKKEHIYKLKDLKIPYVIDYSKTQFTYLEGLTTYFYTNYKKFGTKLLKGFVEKKVDRLYDREFKRKFNTMDVSTFIHYTGFDRDIAMLMNSQSNKINTIMFAHTDMFKEYELKQNFNYKIIYRSYLTASKIILVNEELKQSYLDNVPETKKIEVLDNFLGYEKIVQSGTENLYKEMLDYQVIYSPSKTIWQKVETQTITNSDSIFSVNAQNLFLKSKIFDICDLKHLKSHVNDIVDLIEHEMSNVTKRKFDEKHTISTENLAYIYGISKLFLLNDLLNPEIKTFINVGRFSVEKSHERLIKAFETVNAQDKNTRLILVAPHGPLKSDVINQIKNSESCDSIHVLSGMKNPYALIKQCDAFVLSSLYEGQGLVVFESIALNVPVITVDLPATRSVLDEFSVEGKYAAMIVENSESGITKGIFDFVNNDIELGEFDFSAMEKNSKLQWDKIINE